jgi:hypothetical protein
MAKIKFKCDYCGKTTEKERGHYNRARRLGLGCYCDRKCAGLGRREYSSPQEKKDIIATYDAFIREFNKDEDPELEYLQRAVYFQWDYQRHPEKYRKIRQERMSAHVEYCRQPEYREYKKKYDEQYCAKKNYGEYWEAAIVLKQLENIIPHRLADKEKKIYKKSTTKRKRLWQKMLKQTKNLQPKI